MSSHSLGSVDTGAPQKSPVERTLKLLAGTLFVLGGIYVIGGWIQGVLEDTQKSHLEGDFVTLSNAIKRRDMKAPLLDHDLTKLQGEELANIPRDPWGHTYYYDWFNGRIVSSGADGLLETPIPGLTPESNDPSDDQISTLVPMPNIIYVSPGEPDTQIVMVKQDGTDPITLARVPGQVKDLEGLSESPFLLLTTKTGARYRVGLINLPQVLGRLRLADTITASPVGELTPADMDVTSMSLFSEGNDWVFLEASKGGSDQRGLYKLDYKSRSVNAVLPGGGAGAEPAVDRGGRTIYYVSHQGPRKSIMRFTMAGLSSPESVVSFPDVDVTHPAPSARGQYLGYLEERGSTAKLKVIDVKSRRELFSAGPVWPKTPIVWSPDDDKIGYFVPEGNQPVLILTHVKKHVSVTLDGLTIRIGRFIWVRG